MGPRDEQPPPSVQVARYMGAGLSWAISALVFMLVGAWLGERLGSRSVGALIGAFAGGGAGFYWMVRSLTDASTRGAAPPPAASEGDEAKRDE